MFTIIVKEHETPGEASDEAISPTYQQTIENLDLPELIAFINRKRRKPRADAGKTRKGDA